MKIDVLTLFPELFTGPVDVSIVARARKNGLLNLQIHDLRQWTRDRHKTVDDKPFGGGAGMVLKPEPIFEAVEALAQDATHVILTTPAGRPFNQALARELAGTNVKLVEAAQTQSLADAGQQTEVWWYLLWVVVAVLSGEQVLGWFFGRSRS